MSAALLLPRKFGTARKISALLRIISVILAAPLTFFAATSTIWQVSGFNDLLKGRLSGVSLDANGRLAPGPSMRWNTALGQPALWALAAGPDGSIYAVTGHSGKVFRVTADGKASIFWSAPQAEVFALCFARGGTLYAATSPNGGLYRVENGKAAEVWHSPVKYIWSLVPAPDGSVWIGTGDKGRVYRYREGSPASLYYDTGQANVTAMAAAANGHLYVGTEPNGLLYEVQNEGQARVIYDSSLPEIRALAVSADGTLFAAAMGGAVATRSAAAQAAPVPSAAVTATNPTVITVTAAHGNGLPADADQAARTPEQSKAPAASAAAAAASTSGTVTEVSGVEKSAIYRLRPGGAIDTIRTSKDDNVYSIVIDGDSLLYATDERGRLYRWQNGRTSLLAEAGSGEATQLLQSGGNLFAALSNAARLVSFGTAGATPSSYESAVHDATSVARWGHLQVHGAGRGVQFRTRTGFSARPDATWSPWSSPAGNGDTGPLIASPPARFIQFRAEWPRGADSQIDSIEVPFLAQNSAPMVRSVTVSAVSNPNAAKPAGASGAPNSTGAYSITVTDTGDAPAASSASSGSLLVSRLGSSQTQISWQADDPDNDKLVYSLYFRPEEESQWQLIRSHMNENTLLLDPDVLADGRYFFRVTASDAPANAPEYAQQTELISSPVLIDNTPPLVEIVSQQRSGAEADIEIDARDQTSSLRLCEYSLDTGTWQPVEAADGITDSPHERFKVHLDKLRPSEHLVAFRAVDGAGNAGLAKVVLR